MISDMTALTSTEGKDQFYPTPDDLAEKMLEGIEWDMVTNVLEPSAGKGNLVLAAIKACGARNKLNVDCIEIDPCLRAILKQNYSTEWERLLRDRWLYLDELPYEEKSKYSNEILYLRHKLDGFDKTNINIVHDNFLTYHAWRHYHLILMNPPFESGDLHLLKALELQKDGGSIVCLLNAETLRNSYTSTRQLLMRELNKYEAQITYISDAFKKAERRSDVDVAIVRITIPPKIEERSNIWERMEKAAANCLIAVLEGRRY